MSTMKKHVVCLVGLKGSGKSTLGKILESNMGWKFVRVEDVWFELSVNWSGSREAYLQEGFRLQTKLILDCLKTDPTVVFESTGTTLHFALMLNDLLKVARVSLVKVECDSAICAERVRERDSSNHVRISDSQLQEINLEASKVEMRWDYVGRNGESSSPEKNGRAYSLSRPPQ